MNKQKLSKALLNFTARANAVLTSARGDFYISDAVKIIIAVVLGTLLLLALTGLFNGTVIPRITQEIEGLFSLRIRKAGSFPIEWEGPRYLFSCIFCTHVLLILEMDNARKWNLSLSNVTSFCQKH